MTLAPVPPRSRADSIGRWSLSFFRPYRGRVAVLAGLSLAEIALRALAPWPLKTIIDRVFASHAAPVPVLSRLAHSPAALLVAVAFVGLLLQLGHELVLMLHSRLQTRIAQGMVYDVRARLFAHLQYLSLAHHVTQSTADSVYRLETDAGCLDQLLLRGLFPMVFSVLTLIVMFGVLLRIDASLAVLSIVVVPVLYFALRMYMRRMQPRAERAKELESRVVGRLLESLTAIRLVKTFAREEHELHRFNGVAGEAIRERLAVADQESLFGFLVGATTMAGSAAVLAVGGLHVLSGKLTIGTLLVVITYLGFVYGPMSAIATTIGSLNHSLASARRVRQVLGLPREAHDQGDVIHPARLRGEVRFEHVSFAYGPERHVLRDVSFSARPGETVALVGLSGAGKTTLVSLLGRLYDASSGRVLVDGVDVQRYSLRGLREQIAVVLQDSVLLSGTIKENIRYGRLDATDEEIVLASRAAHVHEFVETLPRGYDTPLAESGSGLSGGQRQRLSIARAFLKDAPILILDEPTASLDTLAERAVLRALGELRQGRTTFVIAHRLSSVRDADRILVLDSGRIVAEGRHEALLASNALYRQLCTQLVDGDHEPAHDPELVQTSKPA